MLTRKFLTRALMAPLAAVPLWMAVGLVTANPGDLDPSFDVDGWAQGGLDASAMALADDGRVVTLESCAPGPGQTGSICVRRFNSDGSLDTTFGGDGDVSIDMMHGLLTASAVDVASDGRVILGGYCWANNVARNDFCLARLNIDGTLDTSFGGDGRVEMDLLWLTLLGPLPMDDYLTDVAVQSDGKVVAGGYCWGTVTIDNVNHSHYDFCLARFNDDGTPDIGFGDTNPSSPPSRLGQSTALLGLGNYNQLTAITIDGQGRTLASGYCTDGGLNQDFCVARYEEGVLDPAFGPGNGAVGTDPVPFGYPYGGASALAVDQDDGVILVGSCTGPVLCIFRYDSAGNLDPSFDGDGFLNDTFGTIHTAGLGIAVQTDGKLVMVAVCGNFGFSPPQGAFCLARYLANGTLDSDFGFGGHASSSLLAMNSARDIAIQPDGHILVGGACSTFSSSTGCIARFAGCTSADLDCDERPNQPPLLHAGPANLDPNTDNCPSVNNAGQLNRDGNFVDLHPAKVFDDVTLAMSDGEGDACDTDDDNDGRSDSDELAGIGCGTFASPTDPLKADTDGDRAIDGAECQLGTNPNSTSSAPTLVLCGGTADGDGDGLLAGRERCYFGTLDSNANSDGDGCGDLREVMTINADNNVNAIDLGLVASAFGSYPFGAAAYFYDFDVTKDGSINAIDLGLVAAAFGACP